MTTTAAEPDAADTPPAPEPERPMPTNVFQALARVMGDLPGIGKTEHSDQGYDYRGIESITRHAQALFAKYGVVPVPRVVSRTVKEFPINSRPWTEDCLEVVYRVHGPGGAEDYVEVGPLVALGRDNSDKGPNKCMTQAYKYMLLQVLCIGDAKDDGDGEEAHQADAAPATYTPEQEARGRYVLAARELPPDARNLLREWCDGHGYPRVVGNWTDEQLADAEAVLDQLAQAAQEAQEAADAARAADAAAKPAEAASGPQGPAGGQPVVPWAWPERLESGRWPGGYVPADGEAAAYADWAALQPGPSPVRPPEPDEVPEPRPGDGPEATHQPDESDPVPFQRDTDAEDAAVAHGRAIAAHVNGLDKATVVAQLKAHDPPLPTTGDLQALRSRLGKVLWEDGWQPDQQVLA